MLGFKSEARLLGDNARARKDNARLRKRKARVLGSRRKEGEA